MQYATSIGGAITHRPQDEPLVQLLEGARAEKSKDLLEVAGALGFEPVLPAHGETDGFGSEPHTGLPHLALASEDHESASSLIPRYTFVSGLARGVTIEWLPVTKLVQALPAWAVNGLERGQFNIAGGQADRRDVRNGCLLAWRGDGARIIRHAPGRTTSGSPYGRQCLAQLGQVLASSAFWSALRLQAGEVAIIDNHRALRRYRGQESSAGFITAYAADENDGVPPHHALPWLSGSPLLLI